jgi:rRNA maturation protein Nop10
MRRRRNEKNLQTVEHVCKKCGKTIYSYPDRNSKEEKYILSMPEKQWR